MLPGTPAAAEPARQTALPAAAARPQAAAVRRAERSAVRAERREPRPAMDRQAGMLRASRARQASPGAAPGWFPGRCSACCRT
ncbi:hypothetical protein D3229_10570 [Leucobacter aridicollis]|nr:hypothetical protein [Leucobacter aridicollis]